MSNDFITTQEVHVYKYKPWVLLLNIFSLVFIGAIIGIPLMMLITMVASSNNSDTNYRVFTLMLQCVFIPLILLLGYAILMQIITIIQIFTSYVKITPDGIEHKMWPYRHIHSRWSEVDRLGKIIFYDTVYVKSYKVIGLSFTWPLKFLNFFQTSIIISTFNGWPNGQLADDLKHYAPQLFENQPAAGEGLSPNQGSDISGISQENRLLAALSHVSVVVTGIGILFPLIIYISQKGKSAYLAFHALQAFIYQLIGTLFSLIFPLCLTGVIFITVFSAAASENTNTFEPNLAATMIITMVLTLLIVFGSFAYITYGIIGAIMTYQGKDFRYAIIGKRVEKRNHLG